MHFFIFNYLLVFAFLFLLSFKSCTKALWIALCLNYLTWKWLLKTHKWLISQTTCVTWKHFIVFLKKTFCTMFPIKEAHRWLFYSCGNATQESQWNIVRVMDKRSQWSGWWTACSQDSAAGHSFSSSLDFNFVRCSSFHQVGASLHLRRCVVDSAPFLENLNKGKQE